MAETDNPDAPIGTPRSSRFGEGTESKSVRRDRGQSGPGRIVQFLHDVRAEMKRVSWPTITEVKNTTIITLIAVIFFAVYLFAVDQGLSRLILGIDWLLEKIARFLGLG
ncbi:MAG TPA: preprotein translocase subunit SecE [Pyrinomonadaceae bacterium]|jgi:preprotein translocase subunit SecE|nr:preprotein translocase subunit SecE [Pyrinomonadaceae bacterium]